MSKTLRIEEDMNAPKDRRMLKDERWGKRLTE
jgi:hypothetical protein